MLAQRRAAGPLGATTHLDIDRVERELPCVLDEIRSWIESANGDAFDLLLRALGAARTAPTEEVAIRAEAPLIDEVPQSLATIGRTSA